MTGAKILREVSRFFFHNCKNVGAEKLDFIRWGDEIGALADLLDKIDPDALRALAAGTWQAVPLGNALLFEARSILAFHEAAMDAFDLADKEAKLAAKNMEIGVLLHTVREIEAMLAAAPKTPEGEE